MFSAEHKTFELPHSLHSGPRPELKTNKIVRLNDNVAAATPGGLVPKYHP